jgi:hypothetical protein
MNKTLILAAAMVSLAACASMDQVRAHNRSQLMKLSPGMTRGEVLAVMGQETVNVDGEKVTNPYRNESYRAGDQSFEILFYYTDLKARDGAITDDELTPLVLKDGVLDGWGWSYLHDVAAKYEIRLR